MAGVLDAIESLMVESGAGADASDTGGPGRVFCPHVPLRAERTPGWAVCNPIRPAFHALALSQMSETQQERHRHNSMLLNKIERATAFSCSEGSESVWPTPIQLCVCTCVRVSV